MPDCRWRLLPVNAMVDTGVLKKKQLVNVPEVTPQLQLILDSETLNNNVPPGPELRETAAPPVPVTARSRIKTPVLFVCIAARTKRLSPWTEVRLSMT